MIKKGEIVYCNLIILKKDKKQEINEVVYKEVNGLYKNNKVIDIQIIKRLGFENRAKGYNIGIKSEDKRNNTTGAYE